MATIASGCRARTRVDDKADSLSHPACDVKLLKPSAAPQFAMRSRQRKILAAIFSKLHARLAVQAQANGSSLNNWLVTALNKLTEQHA
ncbi:MAG: toxin-antitoxin system HicB family antitoxin [Deltaproteobacteria bacterium]|nr:toxin-antitoxin system HicB family antitoxin [Deltaproteobacteria bacterium]